MLALMPVTNIVDRRIYRTGNLECQLHQDCVDPAFTSTPFAT